MEIYQRIGLDSYERCFESFFISRADADESLSKFSEKIAQCLLLREKKVEENDEEWKEENVCAILILYFIMRFFFEL